MKTTIRPSKKKLKNNLLFQAPTGSKPMTNASQRLQDLETERERLTKEKRELNERIGDVNIRSGVYAESEAERDKRHQVYTKSSDVTMKVQATNESDQLMAQYRGIASQAFELDRRIERLPLEIVLEDCPRLINDYVKTAHSLSRLYAEIYVRLAHKPGPSSNNFRLQHPRLPMAGPEFQSLRDIHIPNMIAEAETALKERIRGIKDDLNYD